MSSSEIHVGEQIRAFRKKKKLSLTDLSKITGIAASNLSSIETGQILAHVEYAREDCFRISSSGRSIFGRSAVQEGSIVPER